MLKKLWCFVWGHKISYDAFTGKYGMVDIFGDRTQVPVMKKCFYSQCPRCGKKL